VPHKYDRLTVDLLLCPSNTSGTAASTGSAAERIAASGRKFRSKGRYFLGDIFALTNGASDLADFIGVHHQFLKWLPAIGTNKLKKWHKFLRVLKYYITYLKLLVDTIVVH
jgi:hypothetical protein